MLLKILIWLFWKINVIFAASQCIIDDKIFEESSFYQSIGGIVGRHFKCNGWHTILTVGRFPGALYRGVQRGASFLTTDLQAAEQGIDDVTQYYTNSVLIESYNMTHFQTAFNKVLESPYWHPKANILIINHERGHQNLAKMFFATWFYRAINVAILQTTDQSTCLISEYSPYTHEHDEMHKYGCWTSRKLGALINNYTNDFVCEEGCHNVTLNSVLRGKNLGTCLGYSSRKIMLADTLNLFQDKSANYHGYTFRAHNQELVPFMGVKLDDAGRPTLDKRDGMIWNVMSQKMNFFLDLTPSKSILYKKFRVDTNVRQIVDCASRKVDLVMYPVYLMDLVIVDMDYSVPYKESGVCYLARRASYVNIFDSFSLSDNAFGSTVFLLFIFSLWFVIFLFYADEAGGMRFSLDLAGRAFVNTIRNVLTSSLFRPPKQKTFRIFMFVALYGSYVLNFASQATIISYFTTFTRGKEINTLDDIIAKGYPIIGLTTPDAIFPDTEERFLKLNSKLVGTQDMYGCAYQMINDSHRFCLIECSLARYMRRNLLDERGEQYLHVAEERVHSHYLVMILQKHSPMTDRFNKYLLTLVEAGLITKWEENRNKVKREEIPIKPLGLNQLGGVFKLFFLLLAFDTTVFLVELIVGGAKWMIGILKQKYIKLKCIRKAKTQLKLHKNLGKIKLSSVSTQTSEWGGGESVNKI